MSRALLFTCEHASNAVPADLTFLREALGTAIWKTHRAHDIGAAAAARALAERCGAPLASSEVSRLVADTNRSERHPRVLSQPLRALPAARREAILEEHHRPYRERVLAEVHARAPVLHVAVHSFTPVFEGRERAIDLSLLYDPARPTERALAAEWKRRLGARLPTARLRRNAPYRGVSDGLPTALRHRFPDADYAGFELELNQGAFGGAWPAPWIEALAETFGELVR